MQKGKGLGDKVIIFIKIYQPEFSQILIYCPFKYSDNKIT